MLLSTTASAVTTMIWTQNSSEVQWMENVTETSYLMKEDKTAIETTDGIHNSTISSGNIQPNTNNSILGMNSQMTLRFCTVLIIKYERNHKNVILSGRIWNYCWCHLLVCYNSVYCHYRNSGYSSIQVLNIPV